MRLATLIFGLLVLTTSYAYADLYVYETRDGQRLITSEKRTGLKLIEVIQGSSTSSAGTPLKSKPSTKAQLKRLKNVQAAKKLLSETETKDSKSGYDSNSFNDLIHEASVAYDVPFSFVKAVIKIESNFNPRAVSGAGAMGLMQLMPRTASSLNVRDPFDPRQNIFGGAKFLRILIDRYDGDINLVLAAYNAGDAAVARYDGIPYPQTRGYVSKVYSWYRKYLEETESE